MKRLSTTISQSHIPSTPTFNCRSKTSCPLSGDCLQSSLVYICKVNTANITENYPHYIGLTENIFKDRFYKHKNSFKYESKRNATERNYQISYRKISMSSLKRILCGIY